MKRPLILALTIRGFICLAAQALLIRELLVSFYGNELSIGIILANWLILEAIGAGIIGRLSNKIKKPISFFVGLQILSSVFLPISVYLARIIKNILGLPLGEGIGILPIFYSSLFILAPLALSDGAQFTFGCKIYASLTKKDARSIAGGVTTQKASRKKASGFSGATVVSTAGNVKSPALKMPLPALKKPFCGMHRVACSVRPAPRDALPGR